MPTRATPCPLCWKSDARLEVEVRVERMLDTAGAIGVNTQELESCRRGLERDIATLLRARPGHPHELKRSIELGVEVLAGAFKKLAALTAGGNPSASP